MLRACMKWASSLNAYTHVGSRDLLRPLAGLCDPQSNSVQVQQQRTALYPKRAKYARFTKINFSRETGYGESFQPILDRFFRLDNGMWIRPVPGRGKKRYEMTTKQKLKTQRHVFCTQEECLILDRMVEKEYKRPSSIPDDPYRPYHRKDNVLGYKYVPKRFYP